MILVLSTAFLIWGCFAFSCVASLATAWRRLFSVFSFSAAGLASRTADAFLTALATAAGLALEAAGAALFDFTGVRAEAAALVFDLAAALRAAQLEMWKTAQWQSPYYWAAFTLQGEWR